VDALDRERLLARARTARVHPLCADGPPGAPV